MATTARITFESKSAAIPEKIANFFKEKKLSLASKRRVLSVADLDDRTVATVSFADNATLEKALALPIREQELDGENFDIDAEFSGFTILSEGSGVDIVALHGLNGHGFQTWEFQDSRGGNFMWLRDILPTRFPNARILTYGYNADLSSDQSSGRIRTFSETFLAELSQMRDGDSTRKRPLIIIAYSVGGLIVKQALIVANTRANEDFRPVLESVCGVVFLGTPHHGGQDPATFVVNFADALNLTLMQDLNTDSLTLFDLTRDFQQLVEKTKIQIVTLYEMRKTNLSTGPALVVDQRSAILSVPGEISSGVDADHGNMCKFRNQSAQPLTQITNMIKGLERQGKIATKLGYLPSTPVSVGEDDNRSSLPA